MRQTSLVRAALLTLTVSLLALATVPGSAQARTIGGTRSAVMAPQPQPLERAHAHNDYEHTRPLFDALDHGFTSVEADVWLVDGKLFIGHDAPDATRTLQSLYLDPLRRVVHANGGTAYQGWRGSLRLLIDVKSDGPSTWPVIEKALARYPDLMTAWRHGRQHTGPVTAVVSGNRDLPAMKAADMRWSGYDGRLGDLGSGIPSTLMPLVSDNWTKAFTWQGVGPMPEAERAKLREIVARAHRAGYQVRFWATPDQAGDAREAVWREEAAAGVDVLNTDDLPGLQSFLLANDPQERRAA